MHNIRFFVSAVLLVLCFSSCRTQQAVPATTDNNISVSAFVVDILRMCPMTRQWQEVPAVYRLEVTPTKVTSYLPYVWGTSIEQEVRDDMLNFTVPIRRYTTKKDKNGVVYHSFIAQNSAYTFLYNVSISDDGKTHILVTSDRCDSMEFEGWVRK